jgi:hypothetical protein
MSTETRARATMIGFAMLAALFALLIVGAGGCGGGSSTMMPPITGDDVDAGPPTVTTGPYQPLTVGSTWTYHVEDQGVVYDKQSSVEAYEDMGGDIAGTMGFKVRETIKASVQLTWYEVTASDVRRHHDQLADDTGRQLSDEWYSPYLLRVDESPAHLTVGATWTVDYTKTKTTSSKPTATTNQQEGWKVDAVDVVTAVPAGTYNALKITRTDTSDGSTKTQWFVRGVGKVRERTGAGHFEELTSFTIAPG